MSGDVKLAKTANELEVDRITDMTERELLAYVMENPSYLTDSYYSTAGRAIASRYEALAASPSLPTPDAGPVAWRCLITGNPCGTDTRRAGDPCQCKSCRMQASFGATPDAVAKAHQKGFRAGVEAGLREAADFIRPAGEDMAGWARATSLADGIMMLAEEKTLSPPPAGDGWRPIAEFTALNFHGPFGPQVLVGHDEKKWVRMGRLDGVLRRWYYSGTNERSQWAQVEGDEPTHFRDLTAPPSSGGGHDNA